MKELKKRLRLAARSLIYGRPSKYYEDETIAFSFKSLVPTLDPDTRNKRLNIVASSLSRRNAFGGLSTLISLPLELYKHELKDQGWSIRFISMSGEPDAGDNIALYLAGRIGLEASDIEMYFRREGGAPLPVAKSDVFLGSLWFSQSSAMPALRFQQEQFGSAPTPYVALIQDYEPAFHPWSSAYMLAEASYDIDWPRKVVVNSRELADFYTKKGHKHQGMAVFEPKLHVDLAKALATTPRPPKQRRILFYGRPGIRRNCFFATKSALQIWSQTYEGAGNWELISVGEKHDPFELSGGARLTVLGKLTLEQYADELHKAAVGLSLMASPHPSYPPLEMAHFGALTVCNNFECKDLSLWHDNLRPVAIADPEHLAEGLVTACRQFDEDQGVGLSGQSLKPHYLNESNREELTRIAALIQA